jgi:ribosomal protein S27E
MEMPDTKKAGQFRCPQCSAEMEFDPEVGALKCGSCGHVEARPEPCTAEVVAHPIEEALAVTAPHGDKAIEVSCDGCGSVVTFEPPETAGTCLFCGSAIVAQPKAADPLIAPDAVLPAKIPKSAAQKEVRQWLASRWFAPSALKRMTQPEGIGGVYLPFWTYAADTASNYTGERGEHYYETEYYTETDSQGNNVQRSRQVQRTNWYRVSGHVVRRFDNLLIAATRAVKESRLNALEPWDLESLCAYEPAYLAGFKAQRYQVELPAGFEEAKQIMAAEIRSDVEHDIGGDEQRISEVATEYHDVTFRHLLLPVWIGAYRFQQKVYQVAVNARTGEVQGERPYSIAKFGMLVAIVLLIVFLIFMFARSH